MSALIAVENWMIGIGVVLAIPVAVTLPVIGYYWLRDSDSGLADAVRKFLTIGLLVALAAIAIVAVTVVPARMGASIRGHAVDAHQPPTGESK